MVDISPKEIPESTISLLRVLVLPYLIGSLVKTASSKKEDFFESRCEPFTDLLSPQPASCLPNLAMPPLSWRKYVDPGSIIPPYPTFT